MARKHSSLILEEAFKLALEYGDKEAARRTGISHPTVMRYVKARRAELGLWKRGHHLRVPRRSTADKLACIHLALKLYNGGYYTSIAKAVDQAAKKFNFHGLTLLQEWKNNAIWPAQIEAQHPSTLALLALAGKSIQTANPQGQSLMEQCRALKSLWPAARIRSRRAYAGSTGPKSE